MSNMPTAKEMLANAKTDAEYLQEPKQVVIGPNRSIRDNLYVVSLGYGKVLHWGTVTGCIGHHGNDCTRLAATMAMIDTAVAEAIESGASLVEVMDVAEQAQTEVAGYNLSRRGVPDAIIQQARVQITWQRMKDLARRHWMSHRSW